MYVQTTEYLPTLLMVSAGAVVEIVIPGIVLRGILGGNLTRILLEVGNVLRSVAPLQDCCCRRVLLLSLTNEVFPQRLAQLGRQHIPPRSSR